MAEIYQLHPYSFTISGTVIHGDQVGRSIGFPTANLAVQLDPAIVTPGVYFGQCYLTDQPDRSYWCLPYFGPRLIFGEKINSFEVYIYDFNQQIYDQILQVVITHKLREPIDIKSLEELKHQLEQDKARGQSLIKK